MKIKRRKLTPEFEKIFAEWRKNSAKYGDRLTKIETFNMWESVDDVEADCQVVCNIIEHIMEPDKALENIKVLARKAVVFMIQLDALRTADDWRKRISQHFGIASMEQFADRVVILAQPSMTGDLGGNFVTAGKQDHRWNNIERNCKAYPARVKSVPAHDRKAIIACYGPTLADNLDPLKALDGDIVSCSGSHDFLIGHGITPAYHVEADPRPHKAGNLARAVPGVKYLLASMVDQAVFDKLAGGDITLWHVSGEQSAKLIDGFEPDALLIGGRGNVGICAIPLMYELGYRDFHIFGMDCSYKPGAEVKRHAGAHANKNIPVELPLCEAKVEGRTFLTSPIYIKYAGIFFETRHALPDMKCTLYGDSFLTAWADFDAKVRQQKGAA